MQRTCFGVAFFCIGLVAPALSQSPGSNSPAVSLSQKDRQFLAYVVEDDQAESQLAQLAQKNAQAPVVKQFAQLLLDDNQRLGKQLRTL